MTKEELITHLQDIEWEDFEAKEAKDKVPSNVWESVSAFSNTSGGWIVFGVKQIGKKFEVQGVSDGEHIESDFLNTLRGGQKMSCKIFPEARKYSIEGKTVLAFHIPSSPNKPVYFGGTVNNTFIRSGSGDRRATEMEINAMFRDQMFGIKSEEAVPDTSFSDIHPGSYDTYRRHIRNFNPSYPYVNSDDLTFCRKTGIFAKGTTSLSYGGLLMLGKNERIMDYFSTFWVDYIEVPGLSYNEAAQRYTFRMQEQENLWEYYQIIIQRLRLYTDNPFTTTEEGASPEDDSQLYALKEGLVNFLAHSDFFSPTHPTIRVYTNRIEFQNPGAFHMPLEIAMTETISQPRNPSIIKMFRAAKLGENAGYGIDKMRKWKDLTGQDVTFRTDVTHTTVTYFRPNPSEQKAIGSPIGSPTVSPTNSSSKDDARTTILNAMRSTPDIKIEKLAQLCKLSEEGVRYHIKILKKEGYVKRVGRSIGHWEVIKLGEQE